jgi:hypothetical protein
MADSMMLKAAAAMNLTASLRVAGTAAPCSAVSWEAEGSVRRAKAGAVWSKVLRRSLPASWCGDEELVSF